MLLQRLKGSIFRNIDGKGTGGKIMDHQKRCKYKNHQLRVLKRKREEIETCLLV
jgi:hypothetical protein